MKRFVLLFVLLLSAGVLAEELELIELHPSITITGEGAFISVIAELGGIALKNADVRITYPSGEIVETKTDEGGEILLEAEEQGFFLFEIIEEGLTGTEIDVSFLKELNISITRNGNTYTICSDEPLGQIEIIDSGKLKILAADQENCVVYTTTTETFTVKARTETNPEPVEVEAGRVLSIMAPEAVKAGEGFIVRILDNSEPAGGATVGFDGTTEITDSEGEVSFLAGSPGEFGITAEKEGLQPATGTIKVIEELKEFSVSFPEKTGPGRVIRVSVSHEGQPVENALFELGETKKATNPEGFAFFSVSMEGSHMLKVSGKGFEEFLSIVEAKEERIPAILVFVPSAVSEGSSLEVLVKSGGGFLEGATVAVGEMEGKTNSEGRAEFSGLGPGVYEVKASKPGYVEAMASVEVSAKGEKPPAEFQVDLLQIGLLAAGLLVFIYGVHRFRKKRRAMM